MGTYAIQLAKLAGLYVAAIAGSSTQYAKNLGADEVINYKSDNVADAINKIAQKVSISHAFDAVSESHTTETIVEALSKLKGGVVTTVLPTSFEEKSPANVEVIRTMVFTSHKEDSAFAER